MRARVLLALFLVLFVPLAVISTSPPSADQSQIVAFNTKTLKFYCRTCSAAKRCTRNCIDITRAEAKTRGGVPCKICGGTCSVRE
jgi:hypothetical protein